MLEAEGKFTAITLVAQPAGPARGKPSTIIIHVDVKAAHKWFSDHGVTKACLAYHFAKVVTNARPWKSCQHQDAKFVVGHTAEQEGPHAIVEGWQAAARTFVKPADAHLLQRG